MVKYGKVLYVFLVLNVYIILDARTSTSEDILRTA